MTLVCNLLEGAIEYVGENRKTETLEAFYRTLSPEQKNGIRAVAMGCGTPSFRPLSGTFPTPPEESSSTFR